MHGVCPWRRSTAFWWALKNTEVAAVLTFNYGQKGAVSEWDRAHELVVHAREEGVAGYGFSHHPIMLGWTAPDSALTTDWSKESLNPNRKHDGTNLPYTFVPGRNLIMLSIASSFAFDLKATHITGGWVAIDSPYPDCRIQFLKQAKYAINWALGTDDAFLNSRYVSITAPVIGMDKTAVVKMGNELGVPWHLTRSCYSFEEEPCCVCDSCTKRMEAFAANDMRDPIVDQERWSKFLSDHTPGCTDPQGE